jgi:hypothetical protein
MITEEKNLLIAARKDRTRCLLSDRFGMFIHWGLYAIPARGEWIRSMEKISNEAYQRYFDEYNPANYHPEVWARIAKNAGMKYAVLTATHHDGFCLFGTKNPEIHAGDFACPEQIIPPEGLVAEDNQSVPWEACVTLNNHWGYCAADRDSKSSRQVIRALVECVSKNGNIIPKGGICCTPIFMSGGLGRLTSGD